MKWKHLSVDGDMGIEDGFPCAVWGKKETDLIFFPKNIYKGEGARIIESLSLDQSIALETIGFCGVCKARIDELLALGPTSLPN
jgi:hypothetical protein